MALIIGIDPDIKKSGVAIKDEDEVKLNNLTFWELLDYLTFVKNNYIEVIVYVEAGWLNKSNWHKKQGGSAAVNAKIGSYVGANHQIGKMIVEMCQYLKLEHRIIKPTQSKLDHDTFVKITGLKKFKRTNQEKRDAYMLIHGR